ncbi:glycosyltransferase [filamentous cyanobacterium LEGE 11480]|uniref:Glycosyltransferase n=1 Tax=Romeriopsis navalis LEGE 11480 TaxID=2777977 RepID=A0A928VRA2_9CYAN|nr:glycosyltransferase family 10 [Romeriopsis navalis]MBE9031511.1 glycosyltransferase [Romeriopsis navalis LEGE 11480]
MSLTSIGMISSYTGLQPYPVDWLWQQSPKPFGQWGNIQIAAADPTPDYLLLYQFDFPHPPKPLSWKDRLRGRKPQPVQAIDDALFRGVPKSRRMALLREPPLDEVVKFNVWNYDQGRQHCDYVSGPDDAAPMPDYMPAIWYVDVSFRELETMQPPVKTRTCSWITSGINRTANHRKRLAFLQQLSHSQLDCDYYGRDLPDYIQASGRLNNKWHAMSPYFYNLAIENYADNPWYVSEKLWDSLLSWCLPIYYGGSAADKLLPPGSFLRLPSMDEKGLAYIQEMTATPDAWYAAQDAIAEARQIILHKLNLLNWLSEYVEKQR